MSRVQRMTERLGDRRAYPLVQDHHRIVRSAIAEPDGDEVEVLGDGFQIAFAAARKAVRMGVHVGEAIQERDKFFGKTVIVAFRISSLATSGEILATRAVRVLTEHESVFAFGPDRSFELKGLENRFLAASVDWRAGAPGPDPTTAVV